MQITTHQSSQSVRGIRKRRALSLLPLLGALVFAAGLFTLFPAQRSYAAARATTCLTAPSTSTQKHQSCDGQDPIAQGCSTDARTSDRAFITDGKQVIGRLELRFSKGCG